jgi:sucrose phosphorylase
LDFVAHGRESEHADLFLTVDKVFPDGPPTRVELAETALRRSDGPLLDVPIEATGEVETIWATFGDKSTGRIEQIDLDLNAAATRALIRTWFSELHEMGASTVRLDAVGYVTKRAGTTSFMLEPEIWEHLAWLAAAAREFEMDVLPEVHHTRCTHRALAERGYRSYDFVLPAMVLHSFATRSAGDLGTHLATSPRLQVTTLDSHDGIPIMPDLRGVLPPPALQRVVDMCTDRGANLSRVFNHEPGGLDTHQINITYRDALDSDAEYLAARAIQLFAPGIAQVYYVGLLGGRNDDVLHAATGDGRSVNRHNYTSAEIDAALEDPTVQAVMDLVRLRNTHPAFAGTPTYGAEGSVLTATWQTPADRVVLEVDFADGSHTIEV